jgi:hypothetical protein
LSEEFGDAPGSPFVIADPTRKKRAMVWVTDAGREDGFTYLLAFDALTGAPAFLDTDIAKFGGFPSYAPVVGTGRGIFVGTNTGVVGYLNERPIYAKKPPSPEASYVPPSLVGTILGGVASDGGGAWFGPNGVPVPIPPMGPMRDLLPLLAAYGIVMQGSSQERLAVGQEIMKAVSRIASGAEPPSTPTVSMGSALDSGDG